MEQLVLPKEHDEARQGEVFKDLIETPQNGKHFYIESYGCAMNFADSEIVASILQIVRLLLQYLKRKDLHLLQI